MNLGELIFWTLEILVATMAVLVFVVLVIELDKLWDRVQRRRAHRVAKRALSHGGNPVTALDLNVKNADYLPPVITTTCEHVHPTREHEEACERQRIQGGPWT